jgi:hypothetical protein
MEKNWSFEQLNWRAVFVGAVPFVIYLLLFWLLLLIHRYFTPVSSSLIGLFRILGIFVPVLAGYTSGKLAAEHEMRHALVTSFVAVILWRFSYWIAWPPPLFKGFTSTWVPAVILALLGGYFALRARLQQQIEEAGPIDEETYLNELEAQKRKLGKGCAIALLIMAALVALMKLFPG